MCPEETGKERKKGVEKQTQLCQAGVRPLFWPRPQDSEVWETLLFSVVQISVFVTFFSQNLAAWGFPRLCWPDL